MADRVVYHRKLIPGIMALPADGRLVIAGTPRRQVLRGKTATQVVPRILPLLDGTRTEEEIVRELGAPRGQFDRVVAALDSCGLLEPAAGTPALDALPDEVVAHYGRFRDGRVYAGVGEMADVLGAARVCVVAEDDLADKMVQDLLRSGVSEVRRVPWPLSSDDGTGHEPPAWQDHDLVVVVETPEGIRFISEDVRSLTGSGVPVLPFTVTQDHIEAGPWLYPGYGTCADCLARSRRDMGWDGPAGAPSAAVRELAAGLACAEVVSRILGAPGSRLVNQVLRISLPDLTAERYLVVPYPACPDCGFGSPEQDTPEAAELALRNEWLTRLAPAFLQDRQPFSREEDARNRALPAERPRFTTHPSRPLPSAEHTVHGVFGEDAPDRPAALEDEAFLSQLLRRVGGRRRDCDGDPMQRWTPTGGNLGSVELYVLHEPGFPGLPGTLFRYDDLAHALIAVRPDAVPAAQLLAGTDLAADGTPATVIVLVAALGRAAVKYSHAHRLVHLDAGCARTQLDATATGLGRQTTWAECWDERPAQVLRLHDEDQIVTGAALLHATHRGIGADTCL
ncbi:MULTISPECIES: TOMM precursor leader peptide-binding protein [unclassified Streptomyces]|uniref:TOMM precursor leader peptide-binding protein n=1 Tax=unclassified Streptomyces TaxID=2593676 RepID=UPI0036E4E857